MRGGKRENAGAKPKPDALRQVPLTIKIAAHRSDEFRDNAARLGLTLGEYLDLLMSLSDPQSR